LAVDSNHTLNFTTGVTITVAKKAVTVTADNKTKLYGEADPVWTATTIGLVNGDNLDIQYKVSAASGLADRTITPSTSQTYPNYSITFTLGTLTTTARPVTVTADAVSKTYGDVDPALTYNVTTGSLAAGDSFTGVLTRVAGENVGLYAITQNTLALNSNYELTFVGASLEIKARPVTVTPVSGQTAEIGSGYKVQLSVSGLLGTDSYTGDATFTDALGDQLITNKDVAVGSNYILSFTPGVTIEVVEQLPISLTWRETNGSVDTTGLASIGAKIEVTASGGGAGALTWSASGGGCTLNAVSTSGSSETRTIQKNGSGSCTLTVERAASGTRAASEVTQKFTWSNK
jgi:hypothetical protein